MASEPWRALLLSLSEESPRVVLALLKKANLNAAPLSQKDLGQGMTVLWRLVASETGQALLLRLSEEYPRDVLALLKEADLNAVPLSQEHHNQGETVLWWLAARETGRQILIQFSSLLLSDRVNLNAQFKFAESEKYLIEHLAESTAPKAKTLLSYCLLAGGSLKLLPEGTLRMSLIEKQAALAEMVKRAVLIMNRWGWEEPQEATKQNNELNFLDLPVELRPMFCLQLFSSEHPELNGMSPSFFYEVLRRAGEDQHHKNQRNAIISVCKGIGNKLRESVVNDKHTALFPDKSLTTSREKALAKGVTRIVHDYLHNYCKAQGDAFQLTHSFRNAVIDAVYEAVAPCFEKGKPQALKASVIEEVIQSVEEAIQSVLPGLPTETALTPSHVSGLGF